MGFNEDLAKAQKRMNERMEKVVRGGAITCFNTIIIEEVVDTGTLRGNWQASVNTPKLNIVENATTRIENTDEATKGYTIDGSLFLTNNLPYARPIEEGHSKRKGSGRVAATVQKTKYEIQNKLDAIKL